MPVSRRWIGCVAALFGCLLAPRSASAQTPGPTLTLEQAIARALAANPTIAAARLAGPVSVAGVAVARERLNPEVAFEGAKDPPRQSIGATLPLELGGKRGARINVANATVAVSEAELARVTAEVRNDVRRVYFDVVAADQRLAFAEELQTLATRARDAARARVDAGDVPQSDLTQASLALASSDNEVVAARGEAAAAREDLNALLGQPAGTPLTLADQMATGVLMSFQDAMTLAAQSNTELGSLDRQIDAQTARVNLARALRTPDISAGSAFTYDAQPDFDYGWRVTGMIMLPVFATHRAGVLVEEAELTRLRAEREAAVARINGAIAAALARAGAARDRVARYQSEILPLALQAEQQAQVAYTAGQSGLVALVEALRTARETRQQGLQAAQDFQHALADLERAIGAGSR